MTVAQLKASCDSRELTLWSAFFEADSAERRFQAEQAQKERELKQWVNEA